MYKLKDRLVPVLILIMFTVSLLAYDGKPEEAHAGNGNLKAMPTPVPVLLVEAEAQEETYDEHITPAEAGKLKDECGADDIEEPAAGESNGGGIWSLISPAAVHLEENIPASYAEASASVFTDMDRFFAPLGEEQVDLVREYLKEETLKSIRETMKKLGIPDPDEEQGMLACEAALTYLGREYSQKKDERFADCADCSSLVYMAYTDIGIDLKGPDGVTAASEAEKCVEKGWIVSVGYDAEALVPGDILFWTSDDPPYEGRYLDIYHAGLYLGDGKTIEASSSEGEVVIRDIWGEDEIILTARPMWENGSKEEVIARIEQMKAEKAAETVIDAAGTATGNAEDFITDPAAGEEEPVGGPGEEAEEAVEEITEETAGETEDESEECGAPLEGGIRE